jgi:hypothetical protein
MPKQMKGFRDHRFARVQGATKPGHLLHDPRMVLRKTGHSRFLKPWVSRFFLLIRRHYRRGRSTASPQLPFLVSRDGDNSVEVTHQLIDAYMEQVTGGSIGRRLHVGSAVPCKGHAPGRNLLILERC